MKKLCLYCKIDTFIGNRNYYMINDDLWINNIGAKDSGMVCIKCLEEKIGRSLNYKDFTNAKVNFQNEYYLKLKEAAEKGKIELEKI